MFRAFLVIAVLAIALGVPSAARVSADTGLTSAIATAYFPRYDDADLHAIAHARVAELVACDCLSHDGMRPGTAEVIAYNQGFANPIAEAVKQWRTSPEHDAILGNRAYGRIGCAEQVANGVHWFACVLTFGALPPAPAPVLLPNTALPTE